MFLQDWDDGWQSEDMLKLNIWTPSLTGSRPVMFYIHGGGFEFGSSYELPSHEGANMARYHDVVQVSVNHRLNALGFLDMSEVGGAGYEDSSNVGMTDLVAALQWVRDNIANFGGDPNRVMIYGQSGGGGKVATLMGMPSAQGLFHRAAIQSGGSFFGSADEAKELTRQMVKDLGIAPNNIAALQKMDWKDLMAAADAAQGKLPANPHMPFRMHGPPRRFWMPILDGHVIPTGPFQDAAPEISKNVPLMVGSVSEEGNSMASRPTEAEWRANLIKAYGEEKGKALADGMRKAYPEKAVRTLSYMCGGGGFLNGALDAQRRGQYGKDEVRAPRGAGLHLLLHLANQNAGRDSRGLAYRRPAVLLRQYPSLRAGHREHARSAGVGEKDGHCLGELCSYRQSQPTGHSLGTDRSGHQQDHGLGQRTAYGG